MRQLAEEEEDFGKPVRKFRPPPKEKKVEVAKKQATKKKIESDEESDEDSEDSEDEDTKRKAR